LRTSGIADTRGRAGNYPGRIEAESMQLDGYKVVDVKPFETASGAKAIECAGHSTSCSASFRYQGTAGWFDAGVQYFDQINGVSKFQLFVGNQLVSEWQADNKIPTKRIDGHSSTRRMVRGLALRPGDELRIVGVPDGGETAALDYVEILSVQK
jgi:alpha-glucuronidase